MSNIILQPSGNPNARQHYNDTIKNPVTVERIGKFVNSTHLNIIKNIYPKEVAYVWGVTPGKKLINYSKWERIQRGDICLFSRQGHIFNSATVTFKIHNKNLAFDLWGSDDQENTWEYIFFLDEIFDHKIPYKHFNKIVGYKSNFIIRGFNLLDKEKSEKVLNAFKLKSKIYFPKENELLTQKRKLWTQIELKHSLDAYLWMFNKENDRSEYIKSNVYRSLQSCLNQRSIKSIEQRMSNISYVLKKNNILYNKTIKPTLDHVGSIVEKTIIDLYHDLRKSDVYIPQLNDDYDTEKIIRKNAVITGNKAEEKFKVKASEVWGWKVQDKTDQHGLGYDFFCIDKNEDEYFVEIKGCNNNIEAIRMTSNEWEVARDKKFQYILFVISNLDTKPVFHKFINPYEKFIGKEKKYRVISFLVHISKRDLESKI